MTSSTIRLVRLPTKRRWSRCTERYPDDREAAVFYALALNASALKTDKTFANQRKAAEILNKIWKEATEPPRRRALPDPQRRLATIRRGGAGRRDLLRQGRARRATRAAHAVAHLHSAWHVAAIDRLEPRRSRRRP